MNDRLGIYSLGNLAIYHGSSPVTGLASRKAEALLVYLASNPRPHSREVLAEMLWDERSQSQSLANLRVVLSSLRKELGDFVHIEREQVQINPGAQVWLDTAELESLFSAAEEAGGALTPEGKAFFEQALSLYQGAFLEGFFLREASGFEAWQQVERERLHGLLVAGLIDRVGECLQSGQYRLGLSIARRTLELEPLMEAAHHQMMRLLGYSGQREAALDEYEQYAERLSQELGVEPTQELQALYEQLLKGELVGQRSVAGGMAREPRAVGACPYRGLAAFREADAEYFFGREAFNEQLYERVQTQSLVTVIVGSSGAGKSSLVYAGLLPRLQAAGWLILPIRPGSRPLVSLAGGLLPLLEPQLSETERLVERSKLAKAWRGGELELAPVLERVTEKIPDTSRLLLVVDQFEELYTMCPEPEEQHRFLDLLLDAFAKPEGSVESRPFGLLATLRADFMGLSLAHRPFADALQGNSLMLGPMNRSELQAAIEKPAEIQGVGIEAGLVGRILDDVGEEPGNLPLLEFTLTLLWEHLEQGWMTHAAYETIGGVQGALARYADQVYGELDRADQERLRSIMVQLVQPGQGTEDTRRIGRREEFDPRDWDLIRLLADKRLVVTGKGVEGDETVEVVHEALIQRWGRLQEWMERDREFRNWQEGLRAALRGWEHSGRDEGALLRGAPLAQAGEWLEARGEQIGEAEGEYIQASLAERSARVAAETARQEHERALEQRSIRRLRVIVAVLIVASIIGITLSLAVLNQSRIARQNETLAEQNAATAQAESLARATQQALAENEQQKAELQARLAFARELAAAAVTNLEIDPERTILLALESLDLIHTKEGEEALRRGIQDSRVIFTLEGDGSKLNLLAYSQDGSRLAAGSQGGSVFFWDTATGERLKSLSGHTDQVVIVSFSPDGRLLASASWDGTAKIWDVTSGELLQTLTGHLGNPNLELPDYPNAIVSDVKFSPQGDILATASNDGTIKVWDVATWTETRTIAYNGQIPLHLAFSPDGSQLGFVGERGMVRIVNPTSGEESVLLKGHEVGLVRDIAFSPDGNVMLTSGEDNTTRIWDAISGEQLVEFPNIEGTDFSPDGALIAAAGIDGLARIWDLETRREMITLAGHGDRVWYAGFSPDGDRIATSSADGTVRIWDLRVIGEAQTIVPNRDLPLSLVPAIAVSRDGDLLAASSGFGQISLWNPEYGEHLMTFSGHTDFIGGLAFSPDGSRLYSSSDDRTVKVWDTLTGQELLTLEGHENWVNNLALSMNGATLATVSSDKTARLWDASTGEELTVLPLASEAWGVAFSPDGTQLATSDIEGEVIIWDTVSYQPLMVLEHPPEAYKLVFTPDSTQLVTSALDGTVKIWDAQTGKEIRSIKAHQSLIWGVAINSDGSKLATAAGDGTARMWDVASGEVLLTLYGHRDALMDITFNSDGTRLITSSGDGTVRVWILPVNEIIELARMRVTRSLTEEECQKYLHQDACPPLP